MRALLRLAAALLVASAAMAEVPAAPSPLTAVGRGTAIVFSPDLSLENNCAFYERLGFVCYATPSWEDVVEDIRRRNASGSPEEAISVVFLEAHGTLGNGLKLQTSSARNARRSYAAVGALRNGSKPPACVTASWPPATRGAFFVRRSTTPSTASASTCRPPSAS